MPGNGRAQRPAPTSITVMIKIVYIVFDYILKGTMR
jgi:hypothetical protein